MSSLDARIAAAPGYARLESAAGMLLLVGTTAKAAVRPPFPWRSTAVDECSLAIRRAFYPMMISMIIYSLGFVMAIVAGQLLALGTLDRAGGANLVGFAREPAYWACSMIFAGVVGSALTADIGASKVRDELDALRVLGIDPIRSMVVPRVVALTVAAPVLGMLGMFLAMITAYVSYPLLLPNSTQAAFMDSVRAFATVSDIVSFGGRCLIIGFVVAIVSCYKGLAAKGGAEGVGRAVNQCVLITFVFSWVLNVTWNSVFLYNVPAQGALRG